MKAVRRVAGRLGVVVISQGSTAHSLAIAGDNVFRFVPDDIREGEALVALLRRARIDAIVPVWRRDPGNAGLAVSVRRQFRAKGGKVAAGVPYGERTTSFGPVTASLARQVAALRARGSSPSTWRASTRSSTCFASRASTRLWARFPGTEATGSP